MVNKLFNSMRKGRKYSCRVNNLKGIHSLPFPSHPDVYLSMYLFSLMNHSCIMRKLHAKKGLQKTHALPMLFCFENEFGPKINF